MYGTVFALFLASLLPVGQIAFKLKVVDFFNQIATDTKMVHYMFVLYVCWCICGVV